MSVEYIEGYQKAMVEAGQMAAEAAELVIEKAPTLSLWGRIRLAFCMILIPEYTTRALLTDGVKEFRKALIAEADARERIHSA